MIILLTFSLVLAGCGGSTVEKMLKAAVTKQLVWIIQPVHRVSCWLKPVAELKLCPAIAEPMSGFWARP